MTMTAERDKGPLEMDRGNQPQERMPQAMERDNGSLDELAKRLEANRRKREQAQGLIKELYQSDEQIAREMAARMSNLTEGRYSVSAAGVNTTGRRSGHARQTRDGSFINAVLAYVREHPGLGPSAIWEGMAAMGVTTTSPTPEKMVGTNLRNLRLRGLVELRADGWYAREEAAA